MSGGQVLRLTAASTPTWAPGFPARFNFRETGYTIPEPGTLYRRVPQPEGGGKALPSTNLKRREEKAINKATVEVTGFESKPVKTSRGEGTLYLVSTTAGEFSTFDENLAKKARAAWEKNARAEVSYEVRPKGNFINYTLTDIVPGEGGGALTDALPTRSENGNGSSGGRYYKPRDPEEIAAIHRQTALKVAAEAAAPGTPWQGLVEYADSLLPYITSGEVPGGDEFGGTF